MIRTLSISELIKRVQDPVLREKIGLGDIKRTYKLDKNINATNHNPSFDIDEDVLWEGVAAYTVIALDYLI